MLPSCKLISIRKTLTYELFTLGPDETDIDDIQESDVDSPVTQVGGGEIRELQQPLSTLVTDLDAVRDMKDLPPPLLPTTSSHGNVSSHTI